MAVVKPKISVIMSVYNGEKYLNKAIESTLTQTFRDFEFIIVDDGSTDSSLRIIESYKDERIILRKNIINIGLTKSLNRALRMAKGEYIARQDADDISLPNRLKEQFIQFENNPDLALLGTGSYLINEQGGILRKEIPLKNPKTALNKHNQFVHGSVMFRKEIINELGAYNTLFRYSQDYELWLRIAKHYQIANITHPLYKKRRHAGSVQAMKRNEGALYHLLGQRMIEKGIDKDLLIIIKREGIKSFSGYLNKKEMIYLHKTIARAYMAHGDSPLAREEYKKVLSITPFDIKSIINFLISYLGTDTVDNITKIHLSLKSFLNIGKKLG